MGNYSDLSLGNLLTILFSSNVRFQGNTDHTDWDFVKMIRDGDPKGREYRFNLQSSLSPASVRYRSQGDKSFPKVQLPDTAEYTAHYTDIVSSVGLSYSLYEAAVIAKDNKYADAFATAIKSNAISQKKRLAADLYLDGSGVVAQVASTDATNIATGTIVVTLDTTSAARGHTGALEVGDKLICAALNGTVQTPSGGSGFSYYKVDSVNRAADTAVLSLRDSDDAVVSSYSGNEPVATEVLYLNDTYTTYPDLTSALDYGRQKHMPGLPSLAAGDGRLVHGMTMSDQLAGSDYDADGEVIGLRHIQRALTNAKTAVGEQDFRWEKFIAAPEVFDDFIEINETDKRIRTEADAKRGGSKFVYQHRSDTVELMTSIYCPKNKIWMPPTPANKEAKILEAKMTDFKPVRAKNGDPFHLDNDSSGYKRDVVGFMESKGTMVCKQPKAIASISNFQRSDQVD